jgi:hypothetical protein
MNDVHRSTRLPKLFKPAKVIALPKPGKDGSDPAHHRPISLFQRQLKTGVVFVELAAAYDMSVHCVERRTYVEVYEDHLLFKKF